MTLFGAWEAQQLTVFIRCFLTAMNIICPGSLLGYNACDMYGLHNVCGTSQPTVSIAWDWTVGFVS